MISAHLKTQFTRIIIFVGPFLQIHSILASSPRVLYTVDYLTDTIYSVNTESGSYEALLTIPGSLDFIDLKTLNSTTLYGLSYNTRHLYGIDVANKTYNVITSTPIGNASELVYTVGIANANTAYVTGFQSNSIYAVNLQTGSSSLFLSIPGNPGLTNIAILNEDTAYVVGYNDNNLYEIHLANATYNVVTSTSIGAPSMPALEGLSLDGDSTAFVIGNLDGHLYEIDLIDGSSSRITSTSIGTPLINLDSHDESGYTVNNLGGQVYKVDLSSGISYVLANISGANLSGITLSPPILQIIPTTFLTGNNLRFAYYLNSNAPQSVISLFSNLINLSEALESAAPTRNAFTTYAAQNGYLTFSRLIEDHERQKRFHYDQTSTQSGRYGIVESCQPTSPFTIWGAPFGEYTTLASEEQTPSFAMSLGGAALGFDYNGENHNLLGSALAYLYTTIQDGSQSGDAQINQGYLALYGTATANKWYFDVGFSGGYYHGDQSRHIVFPNIHETATSHPEGWQFASRLEIGCNKFAERACAPTLFGIAPFLLLDWVGNWEASLSEKGATLLNMGQLHRFSSLLDIEGGLRFHETLFAKNRTLVFHEKIAYLSQQPIHTGTIEAFLLGSPGSFTVKALSQAINLCAIEIGLLSIGSSTTSPYFDIRYNGEFGSGYQLHQGVFEVGKNF